MNKASTAHILGGCPIGATPADGAVDIESRLYGYERFYVVDGSIIPANLGVNPSLTITAMAEHAMSKVAAKVGAKLLPPTTGIRALQLAGVAASGAEDLDSALVGRDGGEPGLREIP
ncbi:MAG: putative cholesterol oxidase [Myxococcaceae bacterium]|nr:putative cholesterol oxidase [Myxococcaceae bacterium]